MRSTIDLPPITDPGFEDAVVAAQETLTAQAIAETFTAAAVVLGVGLLATLAMRRTRPDHTHDDPTLDDHTLDDHTLDDHSPEGATP